MTSEVYFSTSNLTAEPVQWPRQEGGVFVAVGKDVFVCARQRRRSKLGFCICHERRTPILFNRDDVLLYGVPLLNHVVVHERFNGLQGSFTILRPTAGLRRSTRPCLQHLP